ncbi:hypothetical protein M758_12G126800 [Ceratodon purpureus]|nr:hypothetical protein M758_12G126800 [Ceratodon purpureus]
MASTYVPLLYLLVAVLLMSVAHRTESAVVVVGGSKGWTTGFDYNAWASSQNLQLRVGDTLVFSDPDQSYHTVSLLDSADAYQRCTLGGSLTVHPILAGNNYSMTIPASLESKTLYAVCTVPGHCTEGQKMKAAVLPALKAAIPPTASDPNNADLNRYICWTTAILLFAVSFWNSS